MKHILPLFALACLTGSSNQAQADDYQFQGWTVSVNSSTEKATRTVHERVFREVHEVKHVTTYGDSFGLGLGTYRPYYYGGGSNYSYYFPWRTLRYGGLRGFTSYYRPRTIYNYGF